MVAHERLTEPRVTIDWLLAKPRIFSNLPAFLDLSGSFSLGFITRCVNFECIFFVDKEKNVGIYTKARIQRRWALVCLGWIVLLHFCIFCISCAKLDKAGQNAKNEFRDNVLIFKNYIYSFHEYNLLFHCSCTFLSHISGVFSE